MKRLLFIIAALLLLTPTAFAEDMKVQFVDFPTTLYSQPAVSFFTAEQTPEEELYTLFENAILSCCSGNVMYKTTRISLYDYEIPYVDEYGNSTIPNPENAEITQQEMIDIFCSVVYNHPEIGNLVTVFSYSTTGGYYNVFEFVYRQPYSEEIYNSLETDEEKEEYLAKTHNQEKYIEAIKYAYSKAVAPDMTEDWQVLLSIHNYLADTITYPSSHTSDLGTEAEMDEYDEKTDYIVYTPYGALVGDRLAVCQGYSLAFKLLCNMAGIDCGYAVTAGHIWNVAACGDNYYHIDITWDDTARIGTSVKQEDGTTKSYVCTTPHIIHKYFLQTDSESTEAHGSWTSDRPECTDETLHDTIFYGNLDTIQYPIYWEGGYFWFESGTHYIDSTTDVLYHVPSGKFYRLSERGAHPVSESNYLPNIRLDAKMYNAFTDGTACYIAIDGTPNTSAELYAAAYTEDGVLEWAEKYDITFNEYGEAVGEFPKETDKLMLFADGTLTPIAYSKG
ncbi:MAG: hypothetical protein IJ366_02590 [Clostridia bacterium]|nr:hypothetical protein [Clostridia bacterium]